MPDPEVFPPKAGLYPDVHLGDGQWEHVVRALRRTGTRRDARIADRISGQVQKMRRQRVEREGR